MPFDLSGLDLSAPSPFFKGAAQKTTLAYVRDVTDEDLATLATVPTDSHTPAIQKLRTSHHQLARLLAEGRSDVECSYITGYTPARISLLRKDPSFDELVQYYSAQVEEVYLSVHERIASLSLDVLEELKDRFEARPDDFSNTELRQLLETTLDRSGHGPKATQVHEFGPGTVSAILEEVKREVESRRNGRIKTLDAQAKAPESQEPAVGDDLGIPTRLPSGGAEIVRLPRSGEDL